MDDKSKDCQNINSYLNKKIGSKMASHLKWKCSTAHISHFLASTPDCEIL